MHIGTDQSQNNIAINIFLFLFFFNDTATTEIYTLSLHDALPIFGNLDAELLFERHHQLDGVEGIDRKSTRLNSSHVEISYAVFCLKKQKDSLLAARIIVPQKPSYEWRSNSCRL